MITQNRSSKKTNAGLMICDACQRAISIQGIRINELKAGEFEVRYFSCPHCGERFYVSTLDQQQREVAEEQKRLTKKIKLGMEKHFKKRTVEGYRHRLLKLTDEARERERGYLSRIGRRLLDGETPEDAVRNVEESNGQATGD